MNYIITYKALKDNFVIRSGVYNVKNQHNELSASYNLKGFLLKKIKSADTIKITCIQENPDIKDVFGGVFGDIFK